ncbi:MAG: hypothetical protein KC435_01155 [Thermomicrobiales bacterium]|nr:hypothetical protein [Thermomicrobiales bacterium]
MTRFFRSPVALILLAMLLIGGLITANMAYQHVDLQPVDASGTGLTVDEQAYYEYVAPRLDALVEEVSATREMVEGKSRDILALTRAGTVIETLTGEIRAYGEDHGVPNRFADVHARILAASDTVTSAFDAARTALRTFNFSGMSDLVTEFGAAADEFTASQHDLESLAGS